MADPVTMGLALAGLSLAATAAGTVASMNTARHTAEADAQAANVRASLGISEATRQQQAVGKQAQVERSERAQVAERERSTLLALAAERGSLGSTLTDRFVGQSLHFQAEDEGRIEFNAQQQIDALDSEKAALQQGAENVAALARNRARTGRTSGILSGIGSGLQIASSAYGQYREQQRQQRGVRAE